MYVKLHCALDKRDEHLRAVEARIKGLASTILTVRYWAEQSEERYQYDNAGNRIKVTSVRGESSDTGPAKTTTISNYSYWENSDRIRIVSDGTESWAYVYDENGNLAEKGNSFTDEAGAIRFEPDSGLYIRYTDQDRIKLQLYAVFLKRNVFSTENAKEALKQKVLELLNDLWNRMVRVERSESGMSNTVEQATYAYDSRGLRILKTSRTGRYEYSYGLDGNVLCERRRLATGERVQLDFVYAFSQLLGWTERMLDEQTGDYSAASAYWAASDHLGSVSMATDRNGQVVMRRDYSAFGQAQDEQTGMGTALGPRYTGKDWDEDAGLYYYNARWYDPELGRFTTEDPIRDGTNWYVYVNNRPLNLVDPSGLAPRQDKGMIIDGDEGLSDKHYAKKEKRRKINKKIQEEDIKAKEDAEHAELIKERNLRKMAADEVIPEDPILASRITDGSYSWLPEEDPCT
ncbi:MAG TPA: RHS repeat-associated core domain-containing protein, partial [Spirochaetales bacterium]|nr:RHS repeat-associated core domain-containing protein [Spirochaetales bacterium]